jgi:hypothetical protein
MSKKKSPKDADEHLPQTAVEKAVADEAEREEDTRFTERQYKGQQEFDHDLYKLRVATLRRNVSYNKKPNWETLEHVHTYHSVDSSGSPQRYCTPIGGHFHEMTAMPSKKPGGVPKILCGPPLKFVRDSEGRKIAIAIQDDNHTHDVEYRFSEKIKARKLDPEFVKFQTIVAERKPKAVEGVSG